MTYFEAASAKPVREFRNTRARQAETVYYKEHCDKQNCRRRNKLYEKILRILGKNRYLMIEFEQRDIAMYNPDTDYFYECGFSDGIYFAQTLQDMEQFKNSIDICKPAVTTQRVSETVGK